MPDVVLYGYSNGPVGLALEDALGERVVQRLPPEVYRPTKVSPEELEELTGRPSPEAERRAKRLQARQRRDAPPERDPKALAETVIWFMQEGEIEPRDASHHLASFVQFLERCDLDEHVEVRRVVLAGAGDSDETRPGGASRRAHEAFLRLWQSEEPGRVAVTLELPEMREPTQADALAVFQPALEAEVGFHEIG